MLALILTHRDSIRLVDQNVRCLQDRIGEQSDGRPGCSILVRLVLELRHSAGLAESGLAFEHPTQLTVFGYVALHEDRAPGRVKAHRE